MSFVNTIKYLVFIKLMHSISIESINYIVLYLNHEEELCHKSIAIKSSKNTTYLLNWYETICDDLVIENDKENKLMFEFDYSKLPMVNIQFQSLSKNVSGQLSFILKPNGIDYESAELFTRTFENSE